MNEQFSFDLHSHLRPVQWPYAHHFIFSYFPCESSNPILKVIFGIFRSRSTIGLSPTTRSVATAAQWSRPMKLRIPYEFLFSRATETDSG